MQAGHDPERCSCSRCWVCGMVKSSWVGSGKLQGGCPLYMEQGEGTASGVWKSSGGKVNWEKTALRGMDSVRTSGIFCFKYFKWNIWSFHIKMTVSVQIESHWFFIFFNVIKINPQRNPLPSKCRLKQLTLLKCFFSGLHFDEKTNHSFIWLTHGCFSFSPQ